MNINKKDMSDYLETNSFKTQITEKPVECHSLPKFYFQQLTRQKNVKQVI